MIWCFNMAAVVSQILPVTYHCVSSQHVVQWIWNFWRRKKTSLKNRVRLLRRILRDPLWFQNVVLVQCGDAITSLTFLSLPSRFCQNVPDTGFVLCVLTGCQMVLCKWPLKSRHPGEWHVFVLHSAARCWMHASRAKGWICASWLTFTTLGSWAPTSNPSIDQERNETMNLTSLFLSAHCKWPV